MAVAVFRTDAIIGEIEVTDMHAGARLVARFIKLPPGRHGFHIHRAGDLRGEGCKGLCEHYDKGGHHHGGPPPSRNKIKKNTDRHLGDLGNIAMPIRGVFRRAYHLPGVSVRDLWGRSIIVHEDEDDLGKGTWDDSKTTGHSGKRIGCAIFGRTSSCTTVKKTRKNKK